MTEEIIYSELYKITQKNMEKAGTSMTLLEKAFLASVHKDVHCVDILALEDLNREEFLQAAYMNMFHRFPDEGAISRWKAQTNLNDIEYKRNILKSLCNSPEFKMKHTRIRNNIYSSGTRLPIQTFVRSGYSGVDQLMRMYKKLPLWMRKVAKKILK